MLNVVIKKPDALLRASGFSFRLNVHSKRLQVRF